VKAWRVFAPKHAPTAFTGEGARLFGGRLNSPGTPVIYTASSISLATLEMLVHLESSDLLRKYQICEVTFDESLVITLTAKDLPKTWRRSPAPAAVRAVGDQWVASGASAVLRVPSAVVPTEVNYLLNPRHPDFAKVRIGRQKVFAFDRRLA
jgi:RES domain-containing protein